MNGDIAHQSLLVSENYSDYYFIWYQDIGSEFYSFATKHVCDRHTDGQRDRITIPKTALA